MHSSWIWIVDGKPAIATYLEIDSEHGGESAERVDSW